jgi:hypothetical protein
MAANARRLLSAALLLAALIVGLNTTVYEDHSVQFFHRPGLSFCWPGGLCDEGTN